MKWIKAVAAVSLLMLAAACGSSTPKSTVPPATHAKTASSPPAPNLNAELLSLSDLPVGWSVNNSPDNSSGTPQCLQNVKTDMNPASKAQAQFQDGSSGVPALDELLAYFPGQAQQAMAFVARTLQGCGQISFTSAGQTFTGTVGAMSFPPLGDQSSAYQMNLSATVSGITVTAGFDLAAIRKGDTVAVILYADLGTPDVQTFQQLAQDAAAKMS